MRQPHRRVYHPLDFLQDQILLYKEKIECLPSSAKPRAEKLLSELILNEFRIPSTFDFNLLANYCNFRSLTMARIEEILDRVAI